MPQDVNCLNCATGGDVNALGTAVANQATAQATRDTQMYAELYQSQVHLRMVTQQINVSFYVVSGLLIAFFLWQLVAVGLSGLSRRHPY